MVQPPYNENMPSPSAAAGWGSDPPTCAATGSPHQPQRRAARHALAPSPQPPPTPTREAGFVSRIRCSPAHWTDRRLRAGPGGGVGRGWGAGRARSGQGCPRLPPAAHPPRLSSSRETEHGLGGPAPPPGGLPSPEATRPRGTPVPVSQDEEGVRG